MDGDFKNHTEAPQSPEMIKVKMHLKTRNTKSGKKETLDWRNPKTIAKSTFDPTKPTFIFVHGFNSDIDADWLVELVDVRMSFSCL